MLILCMIFSAFKAGNDGLAVYLVNIYKTPYSTHNARHFQVKQSEVLGIQRFISLCEQTFPPMRKKVVKC